MNISQTITPLSAYALCYVPLGVMILGLLAAFAVTDWDARRAYLRVLPTDEAAGNADPPTTLGSPVASQIMDVPLTSADATLRKDMVEPVPVAPVPVPAAPAPAPAAPQDLTIIEGIGPVVADLLRANGIRTFAQIAATPVSRINALLAERKLRADPSTWAEQARLADSGQMEELERLKERLKGGRR